MQHLQELEARLDQLVSENRLLLAAKEEAEDQLAHVGVKRRQSDQALRTRDADLRDRDTEITRLTNSVEWLQSEVRRLTEENATLAEQDQRGTTVKAQGSAVTEELIRTQITTALADRDAQLRRLRDELAAARQMVQELQQQIIAATSADVLVLRDEDYFEVACRKLCEHVQHWVIRFSKHSDRRLARLRHELQTQTPAVAARLQQAVLDGSDVDILLGDRVRRRDLFVAVVMALVWDYVFARYLFGLEREQRQRLKALEKQLSEIGPPRAVAHWRALTLTLLSQRPSFTQQCERDIEAVAQEVLDTLTAVLPPPSPSVETTLRDSLHGVVRRAADLAIEMRTQRAEYLMLPPLRPETDAQHGGVSRRVRFIAAMMNERSGATTSNEALEARGAVVRLVLFPLVVKRGTDLGDADDADDDVVVCPAQVLVARDGEDNGGLRPMDRMSLDAGRSVSSVVPSIDTGMI
jgi:hypothetical protein